jgi:ABC-type Mn2+/Zn2+ transport system ATPase subunit
MFNMSNALITLVNLSIGYHGKSVLNDISLSIACNSFTSILGANGSGKSTMLKTLLGLVPPISGHIRFSQKCSSPLIFGYVPQSTELDAIYPFTGFDVALMGTYARIKPARFVSSNERSFTHQCLEAAGAEEFAKKQFSDLSGGQKQRILIARALVTKPDVLVLDEPTAGVDATATHAVLDFISRLHKEKEITILLVTHDLHIVRQHAQQVIWLFEGRVLHGPVAEMLRPERLREIFKMEVA